MADASLSSIGNGAETATSAATSTNSTADSFAAKIDFVDVIIYTSFALIFDGLGMIPVVGYVTSPLGIGGFRLWFWLKGMNDPSMNFMMGAVGLGEVIPMVSEVLPGVTGYVLTVCGRIMLEQRLKQIAPVARQVAKMPLPPQAKAVAAGVAAAADVAEGQDPRAAVVKEAGSALSGSASGGGAGATATASASAGATASAAAGASSGGATDFSASFDLNAQAQEQVRRSSSGEDIARGTGVRPQSTVENAAPNQLAPESGRFAGGNPTSPGPGPIYSLDEERRRRQEQAKKKKAA